jgi:hypothetical protein
MYYTAIFIEGDGETEVREDYFAAVCTAHEDVGLMDQFSGTVIHLVAGRSLLRMAAHALRVYLHGQDCSCVDIPSHE